MNCREAESRLFAAEGDASERAALDTHLAGCATCRAARDRLAAALDTWRAEARATPVPDTEREWHAVRRRIRGGAGSEAARPRRWLLPWLALPLGAAAALAVTLFVGREEIAPRAAAPQGASADSIDVPGNASTMVYVDDKSGWLIVWASDSGKPI
jgi:predicted anti-sigma-YlaC factor YlaD